MTVGDFATAIVGGLTGTGIAMGALWGMANFLGKVWANRLMEGDKAKFASDLEEQKGKYARELEKLKSDYRHEVDRQLQSLRDQQERGQFVHRLQFETEFKAYFRIWRDFAVARKLCGALRPLVDTDNRAIEVRRAELIPPAQAAYNKFRLGYIQRMPFISDDARRWIVRAIEIMDDELKQFAGRALVPDRRLFGSEIDDVTNNLSKAIRERIGTLTLPDDPPAKSDA